jgi:hypothetical protein
MWTTAAASEWAYDFEAISAWAAGVGMINGGVGIPDSWLSRTSSGAFVSGQHHCRCSIRSHGDDVCIGPQLPLTTNAELTSLPFDEHPHA